MLQAVDDALKSAVEAEKKTSEGADKAFKDAVNALTNYERNHHTHEDVAKRMEKAEEEDKSSLKVLNRLRESFRVREKLIPLLRRILILILSRWRRNQQRKSSFCSTSPFLIGIPSL